MACQQDFVPFKKENYMGQRSLMVLVGMVVVLLTHASVAAAGRVQPGITAGLSAFKINESSDEMGGTFVSDRHYGIAAGGLLDIWVSRFFSIEPGLVFSMRGAFSEYSYTDYDYYSGQDITYHSKSWLKLNYLALPVRVRIKYPDLPGFDPYLLAGFNVGILLSARDRTEATGEPTTEEDWKSHMNAGDFGFEIGTGIGINMEKVVPFVEFVYYTGVANIAKNEDGDRFSVTNKGIEIRSGLKFRM
jgi:hypothetical protein